MRGAGRFVIALVLGLGLVAWVASAIVHQTTRAWFEKDVNLRAQLAVSGARQALIAHWQKEQRAELKGLLAEIAHDERIMAAAACAADLTPLAATKDFPSQFGCADFGDARARQQRRAGSGLERRGARWRRCRAAASTSARSPCSTASGPSASWSWSTT